MIEFGNASVLGKVSNNPIDVYFNFQKSLEMFDKDSTDKV